MAASLLKHGVTFLATLLFADVLPETKPSPYVEDFERKLSDLLEPPEARGPSSGGPPGGGQRSLPTLLPLPWIVGNAAWSLLSVLAACCVATGLHDKDKMVPFPPHSRRDFPDISEGCEDSGICLCGYCCPMVQAAKNAWTVGDLGFWCGFLLFAIPYAFPSVIGWIFFTVVRVYYRTSLRSRAGLSQSCCEDFFIVWCCVPCSVCQEAVFMKWVQQSGTSTSANNGWVGIGQVGTVTVGQPVYMN